MDDVDKEDLEDLVDPDELIDLELEEGLELTASTAREPSSKRLRSLQVVLTTLLESPNLDQDVNRNWVRKSSYTGSDFTDQECDVVLNLANRLRPYIPTRRPDGQGSLNHLTLRAPLVFIANAVLRATGYHKFTRLVYPQVSPSSLYGLQLNARGMFEVFCSKGERQFDIVDSKNVALTNGSMVSTPENKRAVFSAFFNMTEVDNLCNAHGLVFKNRITFVDKYTVRIMGAVISHDNINRFGHPISSQYETKRKKKRNMMAAWAQECSFQGTKKDAEMNAKSAADEAAILTKEVVKLRKSLVALEQLQAQKSREHRNLEKSKETLETVWHEQAYQSLVQARIAVRNVRETLMPLETKLRELRGNTYYWNKVAKIIAWQKNN
ncbi:hypothetical protein BGZ49_005492, partial [Haplosporangium sp. Z 27]